MATLWCLGPILGLFLLYIPGAEAGEYCNTGYGYNYNTYCVYGCCGGSSYSYNQYCCSVSVGLIVGCVFAGITGLCAIISLICWCVKKQGQQGRIIYPGGANVAVVQSQSSAAFSQPGHYGMGMGYPAMPPHAQQPYQPPPYGSVPPPYPYSDPAYPPAAGGFGQGPPPLQAAAGVASKH